MKILILGSGAREKVIYEKLGTKHEISILNVPNFLDIRDFCIKRNIELVIPSTEELFVSWYCRLFINRNTIYYDIWSQ